MPRVTQHLYVLAGFLVVWSLLSQLLICAMLPPQPGDKVLARALTNAETAFLARMYMIWYAG